MPACVLAAALVLSGGAGVLAASDPGRPNGGFVVEAESEAEAGAGGAGGAGDGAACDGGKE